MPGGGRTGCGERPGAGPVRRSPRSIPGGARTAPLSPMSCAGAVLMGLMAFGLMGAALLGAGGGGMEGGGGSGMELDSSCNMPLG